ncbi:hypothetical protein ACFTAO_06440 [Paenibacillus rhizoplanae]
MTLARERGRWRIQELSRRGQVKEAQQADHDYANHTHQLPQVPQAQPVVYGGVRL